MDTAMDSMQRNHDPVLDNDEILRYGRQLIIPAFGIEGQRKLKQSSVLIVGTGGLGAPAAMYLAAAGIGTLGLVDFDTVDATNLHRQVIHTEAAAATNTPKVASARRALESLNSRVRYVEHDLVLDASNALSVLKEYDVVLDCTDNAATRYLLNDACVLLGRPLVSASALRTEGQLTVYHFAGGPCYRCLFPRPPPAAAVTNCADGGVLGPVTGMLGSMQAMEAIKVLLAGVHSAAVPEPVTYAGRMLAVDAWAGTFRTVRLRVRQASCAVCGDTPTITRPMDDYAAFCGSGALDKAPALQLLPPEHRISPRDLASRDLGVDGGNQVLLLDVREPVQFAIAHLPGSVNVPYRQLGKRLGEVRGLTQGKAEVLVLCRRGNDSQRAVNDLRAAGIECADVAGGLEAWSEQVDPSFPRY
ncbi:hypothetical protein H9P43_006192 [Blastocladiella emersonii ATCC 22665]|nr:hypothetical protein H9P43_006192 [Blastocladiella emersonii ATCC 22665]